MSADITCGREGGALIDMKNCICCYYKNTPDGLSIPFCLFNAKQNRTSNRKTEIEKLRVEISDLQLQEEQAYAQGRPQKAESLGRKRKETVKTMENREITYDAVRHINAQAQSIAYIAQEKMNMIIKIEEHLVAACIDTAAAEKLLNKEKSLNGLYNIIAAVSRSCCSEQELDELIKHMADEYYGIGEPTKC